MGAPPTPTSGVIYLLNVPFDSGYKNVIDFDREDVNQIAKAREKYMLSRRLTDESGMHIKYSYDDCQYLRRDGVLKVPVHIDKLYRCNYLMYKNPYYSDRWFYCFVVDQRYVNDNCTALKIETDVYSTWILDVNIDESFVEREHSMTDKPGDNLIPEGLEIGQPVCVDYKNMVDELTPVACVAFMGDNIGSYTIDQNVGSYNGIPATIPFLITTTGRFQTLINNINIANQGDKIFSAFLLPRLAVSTFIAQNSADIMGAKGFSQLSSNYTQGSDTHIISIDKPQTNNGYTPRNKKLLTYPYCYLGFNPPNGTPKIYKFEYFNDSNARDKVKFRFLSEINPNPSVVGIPLNYMGQIEGAAHGVTINGYPSISYKNDYFNSWLAQNSQIVNIAADRAEFNYQMNAQHNEIARERQENIRQAGLIAAAASSANAFIRGNVNSGINQVAQGIYGAYNSDLNTRDLILSANQDAGNYLYDIQSLAAQVEKQSLIPDTGTLSSSNSTLLGYGYFSWSCFITYGLRQDMLERLDRYFDMFGYQTNMLKLPNTTGRKYWNYVKTSNINMHGDIPLADLNKLKAAFDNGITIWHDPDYYGLYVNDLEHDNYNKIV